jgi:chromosome segregation ATPase
MEWPKDYITKDDFNNRLIAVEGSIAESRQEFSDFQAVTVKAFGHIESGLGGVEERLDHVEIRLDHIEVRLDKVETRLDGVEQRLSSIEADVKTILRTMQVHNVLSEKRWEEQRRFNDEIFGRVHSLEVAAA